MMTTESWTIKEGLCRCCHAEGSFKSLACVEYGQEVIYADMLKDCFNINLVPVPGILCVLTYTICSACISKLSDAVKFKKEVARCEEKFNELFNKNVIKAAGSVIEVSVKNELPHSCNGDDFSLPDDKDNFDDLPGYGYDDDDTDDDMTVKEEQLDSSNDGSSILKSMLMSPNENVKKKSKKGQKSKTQAKKKGRPKKIKEEPIAEEGEKRKDHPPVDDYVTKSGNTDKKYNCKACDIAYKRISDLRYHINRTHLKQKFIKCTLCTETFMYHSQRKQHMHEAHLCNKPDKFLCENCNRQFKRKNTLSAHMLDVHIEKKCAYCHLKFARKKYLFHMNEAHDIPMPTCGICGLKTLLESALIRHQRNVHLNEKNKICSVCKKKFHTESNLKDHMITHEQNRVYKCDVCFKDFARKECFNTHYRIHNGERPFLCKLCTATFAQRASLRFHVKNHHVA